MFMNQEYVCNITPTEFEKYCLEILAGFAEEEQLTDFSITHNVKIPVEDGTYQIDIYAVFMAMGVEFKILFECKQYSAPVNREKVAALHSKLNSIGAHKGILLSTSGFQSGAIQYAKVHGIALIRVEDYRFEYLSHSSGKSDNDDDDPFLYAEKHMPPYIAFECTSDAAEPRKVYPTRSMIKELILEMNRQIKEKLGIDVDLNFDEI